MASTFILKRKCFDMSAGGHAIPAWKLKEMYVDAKSSGYKGSLADYKKQQLGVKPEVIGQTPHQAAIVRDITRGGQAGTIDQAHQAADEYRQKTRTTNQALAKDKPNYFKSNQGKGLLSDQRGIQNTLDQKAIAATGGGVSSVSGGVQTRVNTPKPKPNPTTPKPGAMSLSARWNKMGTMGKAGVITAGAGGAYLLGKSLFGGKKD